MSELDRARLAAFLSSRYALPSGDLTVIWEQPDVAVYRVDEALVVRVAPSTRPLERVQGDADVLRFVEEHRIPAERLVLTADGATTTEFDGHGVLVTRYVRGVRATGEIRTLRRLGETLGKIHALPPAITRRAGSLPVEDLAHARADLDSLDVPTARRGEAAQLQSALEQTADCADLHEALVHPDLYPGNAIVTSDGEVVVIDWVGAGRGPRVASLGVLLSWAAVGGLEYVDAVWDGYSAVCVLDEGEYAALDSAVRFRPLAVAVREFAASVKRGDSAPSRGWCDVYLRAAEIATRVRRAL